MKDVRGWLHSIESFGALDGPGIRSIVFLQGCPLRCLFCHNPASWKMEDGREIGSVEVVEDIRRYRHFIENGGVTLSGGEPLMQPDFAAAILQGCHEHGLHTALDTSGGVSLLSCRHAVDEADGAMFDALVQTHASLDIPLIVLSAGQLDAPQLGELFYFLELTAALCAATDGLNPFDRKRSSPTRAQAAALLRG